MTLDDAVGLIAGATNSDGPAETWADLGCGEGTFTRALAMTLPGGSLVHAVDRDDAVLGRIPATVGATSIVAHVADFTTTPLPWIGLDGILLANALHYVANQLAFLKSLAAASHGRPRFLIVEYDTDRANPWIPYPVSRMRLGTLAAGGRWSLRPLGTRPSIYRRAALYAALLE
jgi:SAM-dependent methyltransferase